MLCWIYYKNGPILIISVLITTKYGIWAMILCCSWFSCEISFPKLLTDTLKASFADFMALEHPLLLFWSAKLWTFSSGMSLPPPTTPPHPANIFPFSSLSLFSVWILAPAGSLSSGALSCKALLGLHRAQTQPRYSVLWTCTHQLLESLRANIFSCCSQCACQTRKFLVSTCCLFWDARVSWRPWASLCILSGCWYHADLATVGDWFLPAHIWGLEERLCHLDFVNVVYGVWNLLSYLLCVVFSGEWLGRLKYCHYCHRLPRSLYMFFSFQTFPSLISLGFVLNSSYPWLEACSLLVLSEPGNRLPAGDGSSFLHETNLRPCVHGGSWIIPVPSA